MPISQALVEKAGWVYFVTTFDDTMVKIGYSASHPADYRLRSLQGSSPVPLVLRGFINHPDNATGLERDLHVEFMSSNSHGEWFTAVDDIMSKARSYSEYTEVNKTVNIRLHIRPDSVDQPTKTDLPRCKFCELRKPIKRRRKDGIYGTMCEECFDTMKNS